MGKGDLFKQVTLRLFSRVITKYILLVLEFSVAFQFNLGKL